MRFFSTTWAAVCLALCVACNEPDIAEDVDIELDPNEQTDPEKPDPDPENPDPDKPDPDKPDPEKPDPEPEPEPNPDPEKPDPEKPDPNPNPEPEPQPHPDPNPEPNPEPNPNPDPEPNPEWAAGTFFAPGVTKEKGWYDVNKKRDGLSDGDFLLCWATVGANLMQWWQDYYQSKGYTLPAGTPNGPGSYYELAIFEKAFKPSFDNKGGDTHFGIHWYLTGENKGENYQDFNDPKPGTGGYFKEVFDGIAAQLGGRDHYGEGFNCYDLWGGGKTDPRPAIEIFSEYIRTYLSQGAMGMTIRPGFGTLHDITLWGCDLDAAGLVTALWITDSDDLMSKPSAPRVPILHHLRVKGEASKVKLQGHFTGNPEITGLTSFKAYPPVKL